MSAMHGDPPEYVIFTTPEQRRMVINQGELVYWDEDVAHYKFDGKIFVVEPHRPK
jgi:hypothetical protein